MKWKRVGSGSLGDVYKSSMLIRLAESAYANFFVHLQTIIEQVALNKSSFLLKIQK
jgi:hypothetical protein